MNTIINILDSELTIELHTELWSKLSSETHAELYLELRNNIIIGPQSELNKLIKNE